MGDASTSRRQVLARGLRNPTALAVAPERGLLFLVEGGTAAQVVSVWKADASWHRPLLQVKSADQSD